MVSASGAHDELLPVLQDWQPEPLPVHVLYPANRHLSTKVRVFIDWAAELFSQSPCTRLLTSGAVKKLIAVLCRRAGRALAATQAAAPRLEKQGNTQQLIVHDKPFLILGGELGNSSASSAEYMKPHWPRLKAMNLNTVLAPVYWELIEPTEGKFDWTLGGRAAARRARARSETRGPVVRRVEEQHVHLRAVVGEARSETFSARAARQWRQRGDPVCVLEGHAGRGCTRLCRVHGLPGAETTRATTPCSWCRWRTRSACCRWRASAARWRTGYSTVPCRAELMRALAARGEKLEPELLRALAEERRQILRQLGAGVRRRRMGRRKFSPPGTTRVSPKRWSRPARRATTCRCSSTRR